MGEEFPIIPQRIEWPIIYIYTDVKIQINAKGIMMDPITHPNANKKT